MHTNWNRLSASLRASLIHFEGQVSLILDAEGLYFTYNENDVYPSASTIKLPILLAALSEVEQKRVALDEMMPLPRRVVGGSTLTEYFSPNTRLAFQDLLLCMMAISDNFATNLVIERIGMDRINSYLTELGLEDTRLNRFMMDFAARKAGRENVTTPRDMHRVLQELIKPRKISKGLAEQALGILRKQLFETGFGYFLPEGSVAHKTGSLEGVFHDVGIISLPENPPVIFTYFSAGVESIPKSQLFAAELGRMAFSALERGVIA